MKKVKDIIIRGCIDCPFKNYEYNDFAMGDPETHSCNLLKEEWAKRVVESKNINIDYFINFTTRGKIKSKNKKTLDSCPLLEKDIKINLKDE